MTGRSGRGSPSVLSLASLSAFPSTGLHPLLESPLGRCWVRCYSERGNVKCMRSQYSHLKVTGIIVVTRISNQTTCCSGPFSFVPQEPSSGPPSCAALELHTLSIFDKYNPSFGPTSQVVSLFIPIVLHWVQTYTRPHISSLRLVARNPIMLLIFPIWAPFGQGLPVVHL